MGSLLQGRQHQAGSSPAPRGPKVTAYQGSVASAGRCGDCRLRFVPAFLTPIAEPPSRWLYGGSPPLCPLSPWPRRPLPGAVRLQFGVRARTATGRDLRGCNARWCRGSGQGGPDGIMERIHGKGTRRTTCFMCQGAGYRPPDHPARVTSLDTDAHSCTVPR